MAGKKKWMAGAVHEERRGEFTRKAKAAGMGVQAYAEKVTKPGSRASTRTKRQAAFAKAAKTVSRRKK
jgi:hypothetical protein